MTVPHNNYPPQTSPASQQPATPAAPSETAPPSPAQVALLGVAIAVGLAMVGFVLINIPTAWRAIQSAAVSASAQFFPAQDDKAKSTRQTEGSAALIVKTSSPVVQSGEPFTISWEHQPQRVGSYAISFPCRDGISVYLPDDLGVYAPAPCGAPLRVGGSSEKMVRVIVVSNGSVTYRDMSFAVTFYPEGENGGQTSGSTIVTVEYRADRSLTVPTQETLEQAEERAPSRSERAPQQGAQGSVSERREESVPSQTTNQRSSGSGSQQTAGTPQTSRYPLPPSSSGGTQPTGKANLVVRQIAVGYIDTANNTFIATTSPIAPDKRVAVKFEVKNEGGTTAPRWLFAAVLPTMPPHIFRSQLQQELNPGDRIEFVLAFDKVRADQDQVEVRINVDPENKVNESNEGDNMHSFFVPIRRN